MVFTTLLVPPSLMIFAFVLEAKQTTAQVTKNTYAITSMKSKVDNQDGRFKAVMDSLYRIENRNYEELRSARAERLKNKE